MTRLELLAGLLDQEATDFEVKAPTQIFSQSLEFWQLCMEAYQLLLEKKGVRND